MTLDELNSGRGVDSERQNVFVKFPNPRHPESTGFADEDMVEKHFDAVEELYNILGPDIRVFLGEAAWSGVEADRNENPEALLEFSNRLLNGTGYKMELVDDDK